MSGYLPTCQQTKGERQRVPQSSDSRTLKPQPATPNPYGDHGFSARFRQFSRVWGGIVRPVFNEINGLTALQNYGIQPHICARARARAHTYIPYCVML